MPEMLSAATGVVQAYSRVSSQPGWCVESGHEFAVRRCGCGEIFVAFVELLLKVEVVLFEMADALVEGVDIGGGAEPDSRQVCSPSASESRFSSCWMRALSRAARRGQLADPPAARRV